MYPGFQIWGSSGPLIEEFGGPPNLESTRPIEIQWGPDLCAG